MKNLLIIIAIMTFISSVIFSRCADEYFILETDNETTTTTTYENYTSTSQLTNDTLAPNNVTNLAASLDENEVVITWDIPTDKDYIGVKICKQENNCDNLDVDCEPIWNALYTDTTWVDTNVDEDGKTYCYMLVTFDANFNYSKGSTTTITMPDKSVLEDVTNFYIQNSGNDSITLNWLIPTSGNIQGVIIVRDTTGYPSDPDSGTVIYIGNSASYVDTNLMEGQTYYYTIFTYNNDGYSIGKQAIGIPDDNKQWLFMIYLDADNDLEPDGIADINEMEYGLNQLSVSIRNKIKIVVLIDRSSGYDNSNGNWDVSRIYEILPDAANSTINSLLKTGWWGTTETELDMGVPATLENFINYCHTNYAGYINEALVLWNHGAGARSKTTSNIKSSLKEICFDDDSGNVLYIDQIQSAISSTYSSKLNILGMDACLMGTVEVAYEFRNLVKYLVFSPNTEWSAGWAYDLIFSNILDNMTDRELATLIVQKYKEATAMETTETSTAVTTENLITLKSKIDYLAVKIYNENKKSVIETIRDNTIHYYVDDEDSISAPYIELGDFCEQIKNNILDGFSSQLKTAANDVITELTNTIIYSYAGSSMGDYYGTGSITKKGLSIFFSRGNLDYDSTSHYSYQWWYTTEDTVSLLGTGFLYGKIDFCTSNQNLIVESWRELFEKWYDQPGNGYTPGNY